MIIKEQVFGRLFNDQRNSGQSPLRKLQTHEENSREFAKTLH